MSSGAPEFGSGGYFGGGGGGDGGGGIPGFGGGGFPNMAAMGPRGPFGAWPSCGCSGCIIMLAGILLVFGGCLKMLGQ